MLRPWSKTTVLVFVLSTWLQRVACSVEDYKSFDFVIIGGGTSGLVIANRLSELPHVTVAVIEPGDEQRTNPNVTSVNSFPLGLDSNIDWKYSSIPQSYAGGRVIEYHAGKAIGGTSTINGMTYIRGQKAQIDVWSQLGISGWNWDILLPYYKKAEHFDPPTPAQVAAGASYDPAFHGMHGPVHVGYQYELQNGSFYDTVRQTWRNLGQSLNREANGGDVHGFSVWPKTAVRDKGLRADAAQAYYYPVQGRHNLKVIKGTVTKIRWKSFSHSSHLVTANAVEYIDGHGKTAIVKAQKEVVLSAGSLRTPALLELSGIGNPKILNNFNITVQVSLPGVGENLQDQPNLLLLNYNKANITGSTPYSTFITAADLFGRNASKIAADAKRNLGAWASEISNASDNAVSAEALQHVFSIQHNLAFGREVPSSELLTGAAAFPGVESALLVALWPLIPFSRGTVHIASSDPLQPPAIDPRFFQLDIDLKWAVETARLARRLWETEPMKALVGPAIVPSPKEDAPDAEWEVFVKDIFTSNSHPLGTAAMMARELGGVVDSSLKVYGTANVRVVDASVLPMQISGHLTSTLYAVAERAADMIKGNL